MSKAQLKIRPEVEAEFTRPVLAEPEVVLPQTAVRFNPAACKFPALAQQALAERIALLRAEVHDLRQALQVSRLCEQQRQHELCARREHESNLRRRLADRL